MPSTVTLDYKPIALQGLSGIYGALELRRYATRPAVQEGVLGDEVSSADFKVSPSGGGLNLSVAHGEAYVQGDTTINQGRYYCRGNGAVVTLSLVNAPDAVNPRIDQIVLEVKDDAVDASGLNEARLRVVQGTPTAGATLDNRNGAAALPSTCLRLADLLVPAGFAGPFVANTHVRDRRPWARGFYRRIFRNSNAAAGNDYALSGSSAPLDATNLQPRVECSGVPLRVKLKGLGNLNPSAAGGQVIRRCLIDGATAPQATDQYEVAQAAAIAYNYAIDDEWTPVPAAGSHLVGLAAFGGGSWTSAKLYAQADPLGLCFELEERPIQNADNS